MARWFLVSLALLAFCMPSVAARGAKATPKPGCDHLFELLSQELAADLAFFAKTPLLHALEQKALARYLENRIKPEPPTQPLVNALEKARNFSSVRREGHALAIELKVDAAAWLRTNCLNPTQWHPDALYRELQFSNTEKILFRAVLRGGEKAPETAEYFLARVYPAVQKLTASPPNP